MADRRTIAAVLFAVNACASAVPSTAYVLSSDGRRRIPTPRTYIAQRVIKYLGEQAGYLDQPEDLTIDGRDFLYVADTGNSRIVKLDGTGAVVDLFCGPHEDPLKRPCGVGVFDGHLYIADTGNNRIVHLSAEGDFIEEFVKPDTPLLGEDFIFDPQKVGVTPTGCIYTLKYQSVLMIDAYNQFRGYLGAKPVGFSLVDTLIRTFASREQRDRVARRMPSPYSNFVIADDGDVYATIVNAPTGQIRKINSIGKNTFPDRFFGEARDDDHNPIVPYFADVAVDASGIVSALEQKQKRVYQYDQEGNLLTAFGGSGNWKGAFDMPCSLVVDSHGRVYVLDRNRNNIQVFAPTMFMDTVHRAVNHYSSGSYHEALAPWQEILRIDENYPLAHKGIAKVYLKEESWRDAMREYRLADDRDGYSLAFEQYRHELFRRYFHWAALAAVLLAAALLYGARALKHMADRAARPGIDRSGAPRFAGALELCTLVLFHPLDAFNRIKARREQRLLLLAAILMAAAVLVRFVSVLLVHYPLVSLRPEEARVWVELSRVLVPLLTWAVAMYAVSSVLGGETLLREAFTGAAVSMLPYLALGIPLVLISHLLSGGELWLYSGMRGMIWAWVLLLLFIGTMTLNGYTFGKTMVVYALTGVSMLLLWAVALLVFILTNRVVEFVSGLALEMRFAVLK